MFLPAIHVDCEPVKHERWRDGMQHKIHVLGKQQYYFLLRKLGI